MHCVILKPCLAIFEQYGLQGVQRQGLSPSH